MSSNKDPQRMLYVFPVQIHHAQWWLVKKLKLASKKLLILESQSDHKEWHLVCRSSMILGTWRSGEFFIPLWWLVLSQSWEISRSWAQQIRFASMCSFCCKYLPIRCYIYIYTLVRYIYIWKNMCGNSLHLPIMPIKYLPVHLIYLHVVGLFVLHFYWLFTTCYFLEKKLPKDRTNAKYYYSET